MCLSAASSWSRPPICPCHIFPQRGFWPPLTISPPPFLGKHGLSSCGGQSAVSLLQICRVLGVQGRGQGRAATTKPGASRSGGQPPPRLFLLVLLGFPFVSPRGKCAAAVSVDLEEIRLPAIAVCGVLDVNLLPMPPPPSHSTSGSKHRAKWPLGYICACANMQPAATHPPIPPLQTTRGLPPKYAVRPDHSALPIRGVEGE